MYEWKKMYSTVRFSPPKIENAFDENLNPSESYQELVAYLRTKKLMADAMDLTYNNWKRQSCMWHLVSRYSDDINRYGGEV